MKLFSGIGGIIFISLYGCFVRVLFVRKKCCVSILFRGIGCS